MGLGAGVRLGSGWGGGGGRPCFGFCRQVAGCCMDTVAQYSTVRCICDPKHNMSEPK
jgi:hypothetical protein